MRISGRVIKQNFPAGSKSERAAVMIETDAGQFVLRRQGGNPFRDAELEKLVGQKIEAEGVLTGYTFLMSKWQQLPK